MISAKARFGLWLVLVLALSLWFGFKTLPELRLETDITGMLPQTAPDAAVRQALDRFGAATGKRNLFLIGAADFTTARAAGSAFAQQLREEDRFTEVQFEISRDLAQLDEGYGERRTLLLSDRDRALLADGDRQTLRELALRDLYTPSGLARARPFAEDPFNFYGNFLSQMLANQGHIELRERLLVIDHDHRVDVLVIATLRDSPFMLSAQQPALDAITRATAAAQAVAPQATILSSGILRHAAANSDRGEREISIFGSLSLLGVILAFLLSFRSLRPLLLTLVALGVSSLASITVTQTIFGEVHMMALVFGSSLIGVAVDYSIHFFTDQFRDPPNWTGMQAVHHVGPAVIVGMLTASLGYFAFFVPPFPGLRQMAVFCIAGIFSACLCVLLAYPLLAGKGRAAPPPIARAMRTVTRLSAPQGRGWQLGLLALAALAIFGLSRLGFVDDVRSLQSSPAPLLQEEQQVRERLGGGIDTRFFLVQGSDAEQVLQREEALRARLDAAIAQQTLSAYGALSRQIPSQQRQTDNAALLAAQVYAADGALPALLAELGFDDTVAARDRAVFETARTTPLTLDAWLASNAASTWRELWLGEVGDGAGSVVTLSGVRDVAALRALADELPGVQLVDRVADISAALKHYRSIAAIAFACALVAIAIMLMLRYGPRHGLRHLIAPVGGGLLTLATLGLFGVPATLFTMLALLLVLGLGVDYTVFLSEGKESRPTTLLAITLAGVITLLSFGLLAASQTPFIRSLGLAVLLGVGYTWLLAVLSSAPTASASAKIAVGKS